jgi:hypothetical protein
VNGFEQEILKMPIFPIIFIKDYLVFDFLRHRLNESIIKEV